MKSLLLIVLSTFTTGIAMEAQEFHGDDSEIRVILKKIDSFSKAYMAADYETLAGAYTIDAQILPPGADIIEGRDAIKARWIVPDGVKVLHHKVYPNEIRITGDYAYDVGLYEGRTKRADDTEVSWKGKYVIVWKKVNGDWKIYLDIWNRIDA